MTNDLQSPKSADPGGECLLRGCLGFLVFMLAVLVLFVLPPELQDSLLSFAPVGAGIFVLGLSISWLARNSKRWAFWAVVIFGLVLASYIFMPMLWQLVILPAWRNLLSAIGIG